MVVSCDVLLLVAMSVCIPLDSFVGRVPFMFLGRICISLGDFNVPLSVGGHTTSQTRSAALVPLPGHRDRGTPASPRSLAMLCVRGAVVASARGAESSASG